MKHTGAEGIAGTGGLNDAAQAAARRVDMGSAIIAVASVGAGGDADQPEIGILGAQHGRAPVKVRLPRQKEQFIVRDFQHIALSQAPGNLLPRLRLAMPQRRIEAIANPAAKSPEQIYIDRETMQELYKGLGKLSEREQVYRLYRYGFTDDTEHTLIGTAIHFSLRESRAKKLEEEAMDNLWLELPWWF